ncbi:MAG: hypothetical protein ABR540_13690 [Acidimicrobiales bacterium]
MSNVVGLVRSLPEGFRDLLGERPIDGPRRERSCRRHAPGSPTAIERLICVRDLVHATADHLERLARDVRPVEARCDLSEPIAGYHRWDPDEVISVLAWESDRLARVAEGRAVDDWLPAGLRHGMALIITELLGHVLAEAAQQLSKAELALGS